jgi:O-antigen ligase
MAYRGWVFAISLIVILSVFIGFLYRRKIMLPPVFFILLLFWIAYLMRVITDLETFEVAEVLEMDKGYFYFFTILVTFIPMVAVVFFKPITHNYFMGYLKKLLVLLNLLVFSFVIINFLNTGNPFFRLSITRDGIDFVNPITIGVYASILLIISLFNNNRTLSDYIYIFIAFVNLLLAASKGPLLALLVTSFVGVLFNMSLFYKNVPDFFLKLFLVVIVLGIVLFVFKDLPIIERIINPSVDASSSDRQMIYKESIQQFLDNPVLGSHFIVFNSKAYPHNLLMGVLLSTGIIGLLVILPVFLVYFIVLIRSKFKSPLTLIGLFLFLATLTSGSVFSDTEFWMYLSFIITNQQLFLADSMSN